MTQKLGIIAGNGRFPFLVLDAARSLGREVIVFALKEEAFKEIDEAAAKAHAPVHWISGKALPNTATDTIPPERFIGPAFVIDCSREAAKDPDFLLTKDFILDWEKKHARITPKSWVLMRTDWSKRRDPVEYQNYDEEGQHTPGPDVEAVKFLVGERDVLGFGTESIGTDAGQAYHLRPPYPCHYYMHGAGRSGLQCLTNLDQLPPTGSVVIAAPLKIRNGSGSPLRVLALVHD